MKLSEFRSNVNSARGDDLRLPKTNILYELLDIILEVNLVISTDDRLLKIIEGALKITEMERGFLVLIKNDEIKFALGIDKKGKKLKEKDFDISRTIVENVLTTAQPIFFQRATDDNKSNDANSNSILRLDLHTVMCYPLCYRDKPIGAMYCDHKFLLREGVVDLQIAFQHLANHAAVAIQNSNYVKQ